MFSLSNLPSTTSVWSACTTCISWFMLVQTVLNQVRNLTNQWIPRWLQEIILAKLGGLMGFNPASSQMTLVFDELNGLSRNQMFKASELYLQTRINFSPSVAKLKVFKLPGEENFSVNINQGEEIVDTFEDVQVIWQMTCTESQDKSTGSGKDERRSFELRFDKKYRDKVLSSYLHYVLDKSEAIKEQNKVLRIHQLGSRSQDGWIRGVNFDHPSTFNTLAMDPTFKEELKADLDRFLSRRDFYKRVGKAWKRGYLLYGPPGTGKSSLIAAMANYLKFHIYDLELKSVKSNKDLRSLLVSTANRSIIVIEDIDCNTKFQNRQAGESDPEGEGDSQLTLSGLLNFIDGPWSSCGDQRIIIITTNHIETLDPALLRPGRMDMHILLSYCTPSGFKILASNYLDINHHSMFAEIEELITEEEVTPAEIAEELMRSEEADIALKGLLKHLQMKKLQHGKDGNAEKRKEKEVSEQEQGRQDVKVEAEN